MGGALNGRCGGEDCLDSCGGEGGGRIGRVVIERGRFVSMGMNVFVRV